jgi:acid stress-induced BolA-like protein IbaG/YrbA
VEPREIEQLVRKALPQSNVKAKDTTGTGDHWHVIVIDPAFEGLMPIKRQRLVMEPFKPYIATDQVHALDLVTVTPQEAQERGITTTPSKP